MTEPRGLRDAAIQWIIDRTADGQELVTREDLKDFRFQGEPLALIDRGRGIRVPKHFDFALSIMTSFTPPGKRRPYEDKVESDGLIRYAWFGDDPHHPNNTALRATMEHGVPLIWFIGVAHDPARFQVVAPVYVVGEEPDQKRFILSPVYNTSTGLGIAETSTVDEHMRLYLTQESKRRIHQPIFRSEVLIAYKDRCAVCSLAHRQLLDAAHIVPDSHELGIASVVNGIAMCKIHHAAFDSYFLGIRPDLVIEIRKDLLTEVDGPMLRHGLQELHGKRLMIVPRSGSLKPSADLLEIKFDQFRNATSKDVA